MINAEISRDKEKKTGNVNRHVYKYTNMKIYIYPYIHEREKNWKC